MKRCGESGSCSRQPGEKPTIDDARAFVMTVRNIMLQEDKKEKYDEYLKALKDFREQRTDINGVIERVNEVFKEHEDLILGFNNFLPKECQIRLPLENEIADAVNLMKKVKARFQGNENGVYKSFLEILEKYKKGSMCVIEVYAEVASLFTGHVDLLEEFTRFVPEYRF